jgi:hypothetical protein
VASQSKLMLLPLLLLLLLLLHPEGSQALSLTAPHTAAAAPPGAAHADAAAGSSSRSTGSQQLHLPCWCLSLPLVQLLHPPLLLPPLPPQRQLRHQQCSCHYLPHRRYPKSSGTYC